MAKSGATIKKLVQLGSNPDECWKWLGKKSKSTGYGHKQFYGKTLLAHRWIYQQLFGPIPSDKVINHICGNKECVNPHHLEVVSQATNCRKGKGTKLNIRQVNIIKQAKKHKKSGDANILANKFNVSRQLIHDIWNGRAWN